MGAEIEVRWLELATIERVLDDTPGAPSTVAIIDGEAGIGKSHLLNKAARLARERNLLVIAGGLSEVEQELPWAGLSSLLRRIDEWEPAGFPSAQREQLDRATRRVTTGTVTAPEVAFAFAALISAVADERPLVVIVDDMHWLDRPSAMALATAMRATTEHLTLLVAIRSGHESLLDVARIPDIAVERIHLGGLSVAGLHQAMFQAGVEPPPRPHLVRIHARSNGNPLRAIDLARRTADGETRSVDIAGDVIEPTIVEVGRLCALMTRPTVATIRALVPEPDEALGALERAGTMHIDGGEIRFTHALRRDAMLDGATTIETRALHRRIAAVIDDPEMELFHRAEAADIPDADLAAAMERSALDAVGLGLPELAASRFRRAAALTPPDAERDRWRRLEVFVRESIELGDLDQLGLAIELFESAVGSEEIQRATLNVAELHRQTEGTAAGVAACRTGLDRLADSPAHRVDVLRYLVRLEQFTDIRAGLRTAEQLARDAAATDDPVQSELASAMLASARCLAGLPVDLPSPDGFANEAAALHLAEALVWSSRVADAERILIPLVAEARRKGYPQALMQYLSQLGDAHRRSGRWPEALAELDEAADISALMGEAGGGRSDLAWIQAAKGDLGHARQEIALEASLVPDGAHAWRVQHLARAGFVEVRAGEWTDAARLLREARLTADEIGLFEAAPIPFGHDLVEALLQLGLVDGARAEAEHLLGAAQLAELPLPLALALRSMALADSARSEHEPAIDAIMAAIEFHGEVEDPFEAARTELAAGAILRRAGRRAEARRHLEVAVHVFDELGACGFSASARVALDRLATRKAPDQLTETERRVAELAAIGRSNTEISSELFIAVRTVESNLTRVYRKLGVRSRTQLAGALRTPP